MSKAVSIATLSSRLARGASNHADSASNYPKTRITRFCFIHLLNDLDHSCRVVVRMLEKLENGTLHFTFKKDTFDTRIQRVSWTWAATGIHHGFHMRCLCS